VIPGSVHDGENHIAVNGSNADISGGSFVGTNLRNTTFVGTNFSGADFTNANLRNTDATGANFSNTDLTSTLLRDGTFANAIFDGTVMTGNLLNADFDGASFLNGADLSAATNWATSSWNGALFDGTTLLKASRISALTFNANRAVSTKYIMLIIFCLGERLPPAIILLLLV
jgi:uncharacterized protein YjbI with pentapeptide repeats